jgi:predicted nuclease of predicted toxin-antitoxin system
VRIKTDENIGASGIDLLRCGGHDVTSVLEQGLGGTSDDNLFKVCKAEDRVLVTLDRDFGRVPRFSPDQSAGIVILELGGAASLRGIESRLRDFLALAAAREVAGELWIIEPGRARVHLDRDDEV